MKAIILAAGMGSRIKPLTDNCPKSLLKIGPYTILERMLTHIQACEIEEVILVLGYLKNKIKEHVKLNFPQINISFVENHPYSTTNTAYSLMLAKDLIKGSGFLKFDADVVFDKEILQRLIDCEHKNALCIDKNIRLDSEEIKVVINHENQVLKANKAVAPKEAVGESIGIEKIGAETSPLLFEELETMMNKPQNHQQYCETAYERLIEKKASFYALDISGLQWVEIDTQEDFRMANKIFSHRNIINLATH